VPYQTAGFISYIALVVVEYFWNEGLRLQIIPL
jgi:putative flippase GtrA